MATDFKVDPYAQDYVYGSGDLALSQDLGNNVYLSLMTEQGSHFANPSFGSRLHLLTREKGLDKVAVRAKEYCDEALAWIIADGRASKIDVETELERGVTARLKLRITAWQEGRSQTFEYFKEVR